MILRQAPVTFHVSSGQKRHPIVANLQLLACLVRAFEFGPVSNDPDFAGSLTCSSTVETHSAQ
jgi:hypothetical protein